MKAALRLSLGLVALLALTSTLHDDGAHAGGGGEIRVAVHTIVGQEGRILLGFASPVGGGETLARFCVPIESTEFSVGPTALTSLPAGDPCGDPTPAVLFPFQEWQVTAGIYVGGEQQPRKQVTATIMVDEGVEVLYLDGAALSADTPGDGDCDRDVDAVDALQDLREIAQLAAADCVLGGGNLKCDDGLDAVDALFILRLVASLAINLPGACYAPLPAPSLISPADGGVVGTYPDPVPLEWTEVPEAYGYAVQVDCESCCANNQFCGDVGQGYPAFHLVGGTQDVYNPPGSNLVRWRVWSLVADGVPGQASPWRTFSIGTN